MKYLISGLGGDVAQSISKIIREEWPEARIIGIDISQRNAAKLFCDQFVESPPAKEDQYIPFIQNIIKENNIDLFIPCTEVELLSLSKANLSDEIRKKIVSCSPHIISIGLDKLKTYKFLEENNMAVPWYAESSSGIANRYPCIYKKRTSSGSKDIYRIKSELQAEFFENYSPMGVFQEELGSANNEITCALFRMNADRFECLQLLRELKDGSTSWAKKIEDPEIFNFCKKIADSLDLRGSLNIQLRKTDRGPMILEINPRFSSTVYMRHKMGFKDAVWTLKLFSQGEFKLEKVSVSSKEIVKVFDAEIL